MKLLIYNTNATYQSSLHSYTIFFFLLILIVANTSFAQQSIWVDYLTRNDFYTASNTLDSLTLKNPNVAVPGDVIAYTTQCALIYNRNLHTDIVGKKWALEVNISLSFPGSTPSQSPQSSKLIIQSYQDSSTYENIFTYSPQAGMKEAKLKITSIIGYTFDATANTFSAPITIAKKADLNNLGIPEDIQLELRLIADRKPIFSPTQKLTLGKTLFPSAAAPEKALIYWQYLANTTTSTASSNKFAPNGAIEYELEYVYIDKYAPSPTTVSDTNEIFKQSVRISTTENYYELPLVYNTGKVLYRVRGVGKFWNVTPTQIATNEFTRKRYGNWSAIGSIEILTAFEKDKNWQMQTTFAEDGKRKDVITYRNGSERIEQMVTNLSSNKTALVGESEYNYDGEKSVDILPVPDINPTLKYRRDFNRAAGTNIAFGKQHFDSLTNVSALDSVSGAGLYYSKGNPTYYGNILNGSYLPNAKGFPFSQTHFNRQGKVELQGGLGQDFQLGTGHETQVYYGNPTDTEMRRLFGSNVGNSLHYAKEMQMDANGQVSVVYKDMFGKIIATALVGDAPTNVNLLPNVNGYLVKANLNQNNILDTINYTSISTNKILNAIPNTNYTFTYDLEGIINHGDSTFSICEACIYDWKIRITDKKGNSLPSSALSFPAGSPLTIDPNTQEIVYTFQPSAFTCTQNNYNASVSFSAQFAQIGSYTVTKTLVLASGALDSLYAHIDTIQGYPVLQTFIDDYMANIDTSHCEVCTTCIPPNEDSLSQVSECMSILARIKAQLRPSGEMFDDNTLMMPILLAANIQYFDSTTNSLIPINTLTLAEQYWQEDWLNSLVLHHREYCHYTYCEQDAIEKRYDNKVSHIHTWSEAAANGMLDPTTDWSSNILPMNVPSSVRHVNAALHTTDPFITNNPSFIDTLNHYYRKPNNPNKTLSLWEFVYEGTNKWGHRAADLYQNISLTNPNAPSIDSARWQRFIGLYNGLKAVAKAKMREANACFYYEDDLAIATKPEVSTFDTLDARNDYAGFCEALAKENVGNWMRTLMSKCPSITPNDSLLLANQIVDSLVAHCGAENPFALIMSDEVAAGKWAFIDSYLASIGCGMSIDTLITHPGHYIYGKDSVLTQCKISAKIRNLLDYANSQNFASSTPIINGSTIGCTGMNYIWLAPNKITIGQDTTGDCMCNATLLFLDTLGNNINISQIDLSRLAFDEQAPFSSPSTWPLFSMKPLYTKISGIAETASNPNQKVWLYAMYVNPNGSSCKAIRFTDCKKTLAPIGIYDPQDTLYQYKWDPISYKDSCKKQTVEQVVFLATQAWQEAVDSFTNEISYRYFNQCFQHTEDFYYETTQKEYHYTLYYYDQAGLLVATVPPDGVDVLDATHFNNKGKFIPNMGEPQHRLVSTYKHLSTNQVRWQFTPDGDTTKFMYDSKGRIRMSQNAKQRLNGDYSYTLYDEVGRTKETAQAHLPTTFAFSQTLLDNDTIYPRSLVSAATLSADITDITQTYYNKKETLSPSVSNFTTRNTRNRVAYTKAFANWGDKALNYQGTFYKYNVRGDVSGIVQRIMLPNSSTPIFKRINYRFDLISGKVNEVEFQPDVAAERFIHKYMYDADNRITSVFTSQNGINWTQEASYFYYPHGPLARIELGQDKVQGLDYFYTLQGWIKGINMVGSAVNTAQDPGKDGDNVAVNNLNRWIARDEMALQLGYFNNDYSPIGNSSISLSSPFSTAWSGLSSNILANSNTQKGLYNGNIAFMVSDIAPALNGTANAFYGGSLQAMTYQYDQLNRLTHTFTNHFGASWTANNAYNAQYTYDPNGNILSLFQNGVNSANSIMPMDSFSYHYAKNVNGHLSFNNRLLHVNDAIPANNFGNDIDDEGVFNGTNPNYEYDATGNLTKDREENIDNIEWNMQGKIKKITFTPASNKPEMEFRYDALGNRIVKIVKDHANNAFWNITYYVRDAQGNVLYTQNQKLPTPTSTALTYTKEYTLYGSSRLGTYTENNASLTLKPYPNVKGVAYTNDSALSRRIVGLRAYELTNHLGNVLVTVGDRKLGIATMTGATSADYYTANITSATDYYAFGAEMPNRSFSAGGYRFGFNGKEKDGEVSGNGNQYDYGFRIYNPRLGKFLSMDPHTMKYPYYSPFLYASNSPIYLVDFDGGQSAKSTETQYEISLSVNYSLIKTVRKKQLEKYYSFKLNLSNGYHINGKIELPEATASATFIFDDKWKLLNSEFEGEVQIGGGSLEVAKRSVSLAEVSLNPKFSYNPESGFDYQATDFKLGFTYKDKKNDFECKTEVDNDNITFFDMEIANYGISSGTDYQLNPWAKIKTPLPYSGNLEISIARKEYTMINLDEIQITAKRLPHKWELPLITPTEKRDNTQLKVNDSAIGIRKR